ncbi:hypothetical protein [Staphylococcus pseudintermedius]|uniref:hypothetical protein n=1 Tax=Staphylococcus pseudintermedius TaxID=283734 RepID=UPI00288867F3|nr:hypothetical protein [Staphylococcus pseudintermedius]MDT0872374.1 hypothetical protein [Staphylococcus pseudintermedius]
MNVTELIYDAIVQDENITVADNVFRYAVPQNFHESTNNPIVRIVPLPYHSDEYADDTELTREYDFQIDVWWSVDEPYQQAEAIVQVLKNMNFKMYYREPLYEVETQTFREIIRANGSLLI